MIRVCEIFAGNVTFRTLKNLPNLLKAVFFSSFAEKNNQTP